MRCGTKVPEILTVTVLTTALGMVYAVTSPVRYSPSMRQLIMSPQGSQIT